MLSKIVLHRKIDDPYKDGIKIGNEIKRRLGNPSLMICMTSIYDKEKLKELFKGLGGIISLDGLIGASTGGTFRDSKYIKKNGVLILAFSGHFKYATAYKKINKKENNLEFIGKDLAKDIEKIFIEKYAGLINIDEKFLGFLFLDWGNIKEHLILDGLVNEISIPIVGGTASDNGMFENTFVIYKGNIIENGCVFGVVGGKLKFDIVYGCGYESTNIYARVTKVEGSVIYELDGKPAFQRYVEMISEYTKLPKHVIERYIFTNPKDIVNKLNFNIIHPLGYIDIYGNIVNIHITEVKDNALIVKRNIPKGTFLILMRTDLKQQIKAIYDKTQEIIKDFKNPLLFLNECYILETLKNPLFRKKYNEEELLPYFLEFYRDAKDVKKYMLGDNCVGWLTYGEIVVKDILKIHTRYSYSGVVFELDDIDIDWREGLKSFNFSEEEVEVIVNLLDEQLTIDELSKLTNMSVEKIKKILSKLRNMGLVNYIEETNKYYIDNLKDILKEIHEQLEREYKTKKYEREKILKSL